MVFIVIGNCISLVSAGFRMVGTSATQRKSIFMYQFIDCVLMCVASAFFGAWAGITTLGLSAVRNWMAAHDKFTQKWMIVFVVLVGAAGLLANNRGLVGLMPVMATMLYTVCCYYFKNVKAIKYSVLVNLVIWVTYSLIIYDFVTVAMDSVAGVLTAISLVRLYRQDRREGEAAPALAEESLPAAAEAEINSVPMDVDVLPDQIVKDDDGNMHIAGEEFLMDDVRRGVNPLREGPLAEENEDNDLACADVMDG